MSLDAEADRKVRSLPSRQVALPESGAPGDLDSAGRFIMLADQGSHELGDHRRLGALPLHHQNSALGISVLNRSCVVG